MINAKKNLSPQYGIVIIVHIIGKCTEKYVTIAINQEKNVMIINPELRDLIFPLTDEEYSNLEKSLKEEGCRDAIVAWDDTIVDGHNRYEICQKHHIQFNIIQKKFDDIEQVKDWMESNQLARRNLTNEQRAYLIGRRNMREKKKEPFKGNQYIESGGCHFDTHQKTADKIADEYGISKSTVHRYTNFAKEIDEIKESNPELANDILSNKTTLKEHKKQKKTDKLKQKKHEYIHESKQSIKIMPEIQLMDANDFLNTFNDNSIDLLFTDPPYSTDIEDIETFTEKWLTIAIDKTKKSGRLLICSGAYPIELNAYLNVLLKQDKFIVDNPLIWTYKNTLGVTPKMKYNLNYQVIWHLYSKDSLPLDTSITNEMFSVMEINAPDGRQGNRLHTWQKPDELALKLIRHTTKENDLIVDPFCCTGTFLLAANRLNRISKGCDNNINNLKISEDRGCTMIGM